MAKYVQIGDKIYQEVENNTPSVKKAKKVKKSKQRLKYELWAFLIIAGSFLIVWAFNIIANTWNNTDTKTPTKTVKTVKAAKNEY